MPRKDRETHHRPVKRKCRERQGVERLKRRALLGIEAKAGSALAAEDFKHLKWFAKNFAKGEFTGIVLYSGEHTLRFGDGFYAAPLAALGA